MPTVYLIPAGTRGTIAAPGSPPEPHITRKQLQFQEPPVVDGDGATFKFGTWLLTVPRKAVIMLHNEGTRGWNEVGV